MTIKIKENFIKGKSKQTKLCEDGIFTGNRFVAIVDGSTSKSDFLIEGKKTGKIAMELIIKSLKELDSYNGELNFHDIQYKINNSFHSVYKKYFKNSSEKMIASAAIYDSLQEVIYLIGDCQILLKTGDKERRITNEAKISHVLSNKRAHFNIDLINSGKITEEDLLENDLGRNFILQELRDEVKFINNEDENYGFFVFDGNEIPENKIIIESTKNIDIIVLTSDGYPKIFDNLKETEEYLNIILKDDPLLIHKHRSTKGIQKNNLSFDDRSYLKMEKESPLKHILDNCDFETMKQSLEDNKEWINDKPQGKEII